MNKKSLKNFEKVLLMLVSLELIALSINLFFEPSNVAAGGATGVAILLFEGFNIPTYWSVFSINIVMLIVSYFFLEKITTIKLTFGSFVLPLLLFITPVVDLVSQIFLSIVIGSIIFGIGLAILYTLNMSSGGTTVPPLILHKNFGIERYISLFIIDGIVCIGNIFVTGWLSFGLAVLSIAISSVVIKICTIIEDKYLNF
ncbi:YitT family protein [Companilactobacillus versmoldensis]|uniref:Integral membrane protein n=1 Tax=Companilactobacillus versmoldensis DSM 14857 = KCTC 3814 TaxID=1423815 RepID=A0A0R1SM43_9LACO|nr:YitT family protein [Companilactobacillus versmoldensis]KRL67586.1 integral membrane protein [Companilactobacillus versmoldensis DSM 14857 = KCTC 3814]